MMLGNLVTALTSLTFGVVAIFASSIIIVYEIKEEGKRDCALVDADFCV